MPKLVDHDDHRRDLAQRAAGLFAEHGYSGLGMRAIADALGMSKSALYHYFPTKRDLFIACTAAVTGPGRTGNSAALGQGDNPALPVDQLMAMATEMRTDFAAEMALVFDYLRGKSAAAISADTAMHIARVGYLEQVARIVGEARGHDVLAQIFGALLIDHFAGGDWSESRLRTALVALLDDPV